MKGWYGYGPWTGPPREMTLGTTPREVISHEVGGATWLSEMRERDNRLRALIRFSGEGVGGVLLPWRKAGPSNHHDDRVDSDQ